jgi:hypothetical protein
MGIREEAIERIEAGERLTLAEGQRAMIPR